MSDKKELLDSADRWDRLAVEAENRAAWDRSIGIDLCAPGSSPGDHRARMFRDTAKALRLEADTGIRHCNICFQPHPIDLRHVRRRSLSGRLVKE